MSTETRWPFDNGLKYLRGNSRTPYGLCLVNPISKAISVVLVETPTRLNRDGSSFNCSVALDFGRLKAVTRPD